MKSEWLPFGLGLVVPLALAFLGWRLFRLLTIIVEDEEVVLVESFGKLIASLKTPGLHVFPRRILPWVILRHVSLRRDFLRLNDVHVTDREGTTVIVDLWLDYRVDDAVKAEYAVEHLHEALRKLVVHAALSLLGRRSFYEILCDRSELGELLKNDIRLDTERWGVSIELAFIQKVSLLPEVATRIFDSIASRLGRAKAELQENGRLAIATIEAETSVRVASLVAEAKGQYPRAVGRAMSAMGKTPAVLDAYNELYRLSVLRPHRSTAFIGFGEGEIRAIDAAMIPELTAAPKA